MIRPYDCEVYVNGKPNNMMTTLVIHGEWMKASFMLRDATKKAPRPGDPIAVVVEDCGEGAAFNGLIHTSGIHYGSPFPRLEITAYGHGACRNHTVRLEA